MLNFLKRLCVGSAFAFVISFSAIVAVPSFQAELEQTAVAEQAGPEQADEAKLVSAQVIEETPGPIPQNKLAVRIIGQRDGLVGDLMYFALEVTGTPDSVEWSLDPPVHGFHILDGRRNAVFSNRDTGEYEIYVSVGGDKQVAHDKFKFAIEAGQLPPQAAPAAPTQQFMPQMQMPMMQQQQQMPFGATDWKGGVKVLAERVQSATRRQEGIQLAGSFREVANELRVGTFSGGDPWLEAVKQSREALGASFTPWQQFFRDLITTVASLHQRGVPDVPQQNILLLEGAAEALGDLQ